MARYSQDTIKKALERRNQKLTAGMIVKIRCIAAATKTPKEPNYNLSHELAWALVKDNGETSNVKVRQWVTFPLINEEVKDHAAPDTAGMVIPQVQALWPEECPLYPRRDPKTKEMMYKGEAIEPSSEEDAASEAADACMEFIDALERDPSKWEGREAYAKIYYQKDKQTQIVSDFPSLGNWQAELREGQTTQPEDKWFSSGPVGGVKPSTPAPVNGKKNGIPAKAAAKGKPTFGKKK